MLCSPQDRDALSRGIYRGEEGGGRKGEREREVGKGKQRRRERDRGRYKGGEQRKGYYNTRVLSGDIILGGKHG